MISQSGNFILMALIEGPSGEWFQFDLSDLAAYQLPKCNDWDFGHKHIDLTLNRRHMNRDIFPEGTVYLGASTKSLEPREDLLSESEYANWTFTYLPIGHSVTIYLQVLRYVILDVPINWVYVMAGYNGQWINASNSTGSNFNYLSCTPQGVCKKTQSIDWNPPSWGFDSAEDTCGSCALLVNEDRQAFVPIVRRPT